MNIYVYLSTKKHTQIFHCSWPLSLMLQEFNCCSSSVGTEYHASISMTYKKDYPHYEVLIKIKFSYNLLISTMFYLHRLVQHMVEKP